MLSHIERKCPVRSSGKALPSRKVALGSQRTIADPAGLARRLERCQIALGCLRPRHRSAGRVRAFAHGVPADIVGQQGSNLRADGFRISKGDQNSAPAIQQFPGMPVGCRDDGLSQSGSCMPACRTSSGLH